MNGMGALDKKWPEQAAREHSPERNTDQTASVSSFDIAPRHDRTTQTSGALPQKSNLPLIIVTVVAAVAMAVGGILAGRYFRMQKTIRAILDDAGAFAANGKYEEAITGIEAGLEEYASSKALQDKLTEYQKALTEQEIAQILAEADALAAEGKYKEAQDVLQAGLKDHPASLELNEKLAEYRNDQVNQQINAIIADAEASAAARDRKVQSTVGKEKT